MNTNTSMIDQSEVVTETQFSGGLQVHRHYVVAPLFVLTLVVSIWGMQGVGPALKGFLMNGDVSRSGSVLVYPDGVHAELQDGATVDSSSGSLHVLAGSVLVASQGKTEVHAGNVRLVAFAGGFHVTKNHGSLTVAAITSPVLVTDEIGITVVPVGMQWRTLGDTLTPVSQGIDAWLASRSLSPLPDAFLARQQSQLKSLFSAQTNEALHGSVLPSFLSLIQLPEAQQRSMETQAWTLFDDLSVAVSQGDTQSVTTLLGNSLLTDLLASDEAVPSVTRLLGRSLGTPAIAAKLLPYAAGDQDVWFLAFFHPVVQAATWTLLPPEGLDEDLEALRLFLLPVSDTGPQAISPVVVDQWLSAAHAQLKARKDPLTFLTPLLSELNELVDRLHRLGYPDRFYRYSEAIRSLAAPYASVLSPEAQKILEDLKVLESLPLSEKQAATPVPVIISSSSSSSSAAPFDAGLLEEQMRELLQKSAALFSLHTQIHAVSAGEVSVTGILFASSHGDRAFNFVYNPEKQTVGQIMEGDQSMPYSLPFDAFLKWVRGE